MTFEELEEAAERLEYWHRNKGCYHYPNASGVGCSNELVLVNQTNWFCLLCTNHCSKMNYGQNVTTYTLSAQDVFVLQLLLK